MTYETFELRIQPGLNNGYEALVTRSLAGDARADFVLPFGEDELAAFLWQTVGVSRHLGVTEPAAGQPLDIQDFGTRLYRAVFSGDVGACLLRSLDEARRSRAGLRIRLRIDERLPALADLPWEYLYAPELGRFLAPSDETPLVRYLEVPRRALPLPVPPPLTVLTVLSSPTDVTALAVEREWGLLQNALQGLAARGLLRLERLPTATLEALQGRLRQSAAGGVHVLHFIGHGFFDPEQNLGSLIFEDARGQAQVVPAATLALLLHDHAPLRLVFLNACQGATSGRSSSFAGVAQQLVLAGLPAVVAMQFPVSDQAAIALSQEFYRALADGLPADAALSEARKAIVTQGNRYEWGTPVLFSRSEDNRLIELPQGDRRPIIEIRPFEPETVLIPAGPFLMGCDPMIPFEFLKTEGAERPQHSVVLPDFRIGKYPVTNRQYAAFIKEQKAQAPPQGWFNREPPADRLEHPVTNVSWLDALAYCVWLSQQTGRRYTLPSEAEWEKAARSDDGRLYPWGDTWDPTCANAASSDTTPVTAHPAGASADGVEDLLGNVQEWTRSLWGSQPGQPDFGYPYDPADGREISDPAKLPAQARLVHRGGSFKSTPADLRSSARGNSPPDSKIAWRGLRVALSLEPARP